MSGQPGFLSGRRGLIMGVANDRSIAWGIARQAAEQGAELAFTFQGDALEKRVRPLAESVNAKLVAPCDVTDPDSMDNLFEQVGNTWDKIDFVVHAVAFSDKAELNGRYADTSRDNFLRTMDISCFSFTDVCRRAAPLMPDGGSLLTLSYYGAERVVPHYNVMGVAKAALEASVRYLATDFGRDNIRVNAMSAGPMKTLAASGIGDFRYILKWNELNAPMHRNVTLDDVGRSGIYLVSDLSSGVTGEVHHVDCGYHVVGMMAPESAQDIADLLDGAKLKD
ncbi:MAG: enoyl-ACP reductase FabI [Rhodospirillaceae bacterium]|jgi:enoyl-[acyl-carrier protein] reductase I|nr:enoyl-ACP reductase FabI [Rhodospirillaceae bacterium]MBT5567354.1 enoyl-ACP reductase FabI [Rhodospirillaceae bacterium]MBT6091137.1 enoyl-ACP reductase FabI [Rhodospirillaceae bacterium]MBT7452038.1 enoyl-ACP reductase FabI [Rhodospirillaceae bacterium]